MSTILRSLKQRNGFSLLGTKVTKQIAASNTSIPTVSLPVIGLIGPAANYSRRSASKNVDSSFKAVKSKVRVEEDAEFLGCECGPNWEILAPRGNRFYLPHAIGPAWQGESTTLNLEEPLESLVDFEGTGQNNNLMLQFTVAECPNLIRKSLHELFPAPEVISSNKLALMTLRFSGETEKGARKFVLAAREITTRLRLHGYWADFMNPFSGKPFYSWASGKHLYEVDERFRGLNMRVVTKNHCMIISSESGDSAFSGSIYTNAPSDFLELKSLIDEQV